jgi:hypothetical protein
MGMSTVSVNNGVPRSQYIVEDANMRGISVVFLLFGLFVLNSCATIALDSSTIRQHPVKMNEAGEKEYEVVAEFKVRDKAAWIIGIVPVNKPAGDNHDYLADVIQSEIDKAGGDAAINVKVRAQYAAGDILVQVVTLGIYVPRTVTVSGQVIKYK